MRNTVWHQIATGTIPGLILLAAGFYVFSTKPVDPAEGLEIGYYQSDIATAAIRDVAMKVNPQMDFSSPEVLKLFDRTLVYGDSLNLAIYDLDNRGDRLISEMKISLGTFTYAYLSDGKSFKIIPPESNEVSVTIVPNSTTKLALVRSYGYTWPSERFIVDGRSVPVSSRVGTYDDVFYDLGPYVRNYFFWFLGFAGLGVLSLLMLVYAICAEVFFGRHLGFIAANYDNRHFAKILAAHTHINHDDPERSKAIVGKAERIYKKWNHREGET